MFSYRLTVHTLKTEKTVCEQDSVNLKPLPSYIHCRKVKIILGFHWIFWVCPGLGCPKGFRGTLGSKPYTALLAEKSPERSLSNSNSNFMGTQEKWSFPASLKMKGVFEKTGKLYKITHRNWSWQEKIWLKQDRSFIKNARHRMRDGVNHGLGSKIQKLYFKCWIKVGEEGEMSQNLDFLHDDIINTCSSAFEKLWISGWKNY